MKKNDKLYGFKVKKETEIAEIKATLFELEHEKSGARLLFLDREDENKTFSIAFKTIPEDSTGVFHIIEHSVLCGSKKYPVKDPFVELLKGSLNTFLNAMTFPDKTMYPVASRNDKDFLNLMSIYLDAVLHPAILENPNIFRQEGWHYELESEEGEMTRSGVVLNEMRGAYSSADTLGNYHMQNMLAPDTCYGFESGGKPEFITDLTYENFVAAHKKYYHPSNAEIFLDGSVNLDTVLPLIDEYLKDYDKVAIDFDIEDQAPIKPQRREIEYEIAPNESKENKTKMKLGFYSTRFDEIEKKTSIGILLDAIASSNEAPLKKALIDSGLCEDVSISPFDSVKQNAVIIDFHNVKDGKCDELYSLFTDTVKKISESGIDKGLLEASLNSNEFKTRERDFGTMPAGIIFAMTALETSLYGGDPAANFLYEETFKNVRKNLDGDYFEKLLYSLFIENEHRAVLIMNPSTTLGEENAKREKELLANIKASLSKEEIAEILKMNKELKAWQETPDSEEALKTIPTLSISDIDADVRKIPEEISKLGATTVINHDIATGGITYAELIFDVTDLNEKEVFDLRVLVALLGNVKTESYKAIELQNEIKRELGAFDISAAPVTNQGKARIYLTLSASALDSKKPELLRLIPEVLYTSSFKDKEVIRNIIRQMKLESDESFVTAGHAAGITRSSAYVSQEGAVNEYYSGYEAHVTLKALEKSFDVEFDALCARIEKLCARVFTRERLTVAITGSPDGKFVSDIIASIKECGTAPDLAECKIAPLGVRREGILIPAQASYAELSANLLTLGESFTGSLNVVRSLLSYAYLWNAVRVQGGAYGVGLLARNNGIVGFYSYRDPSPARTVSCYKESSAFLRAFAESGTDITNFIIGAVGDTSPLMTPKLMGSVQTMRYLRGISYEDECKSRREILATDKAELLRIADVIDKVCQLNAICIVADKAKLDTCADIIDTVLEL